MAINAFEFPEFGGPGGKGAVGGGLGLVISANFTVAENAKLKRFPSLKRAVDGIVSAASARVLARVRQVSPVLTGRFRYSWRVERPSFDTARTLRLTNSAPYALYVHPKGTDKSRTVVNVDVPPILREVEAEMRRELAPIRADLARLLVGDIIAPTATGQAASARASAEAKRRFESWVTAQLATGALEVGEGGRLRRGG